MDQRRQFKILFRSFLSRLVDLDVLATGGDVSKLFSQIAALLCAFSFVVALLIIPRYAFSKLNPEQLAFAAWGDQQFFVATSMTVAGLFAVLAWDAIFPGRRDVYVLGTLPVSIKTIFAAKTAAIATGLGLCILSVNSFTGLAYPMVTIGPSAGPLGFARSFLAYWITMLAASLFVFNTLLALQGMAAQLLSYRLFLRVSSYLQVTSFFIILGAFFLTPGSSYISLKDPATAQLTGRIPSYWFLGLFQQLNGPTHPIFYGLAQRALLAFLAALILAAITQSLTYYRTVRKIVEQPDIFPGDRSKSASPVITGLAHLIFYAPFEQAIAKFTARTMIRSRQHRILLAAYAGVGVAISLAYMKYLLYANSPIYQIAIRMTKPPKWYEPNYQLMAVSVVMLFFAVAGTRAVFSLPATLQANWIMSFTLVRKPAAYFQATRRTLYFVAVLPLALAAAFFFVAFWPLIPAVKHLALLAASAVILVEWSLFEFRKIPFTCAYLPGKSNMKVKLGSYGILFLTVIDFGVSIEFWTFRERIRYAAALSAMLYMANWARRRWVSFASKPHHQVQFEDSEEPAVSPLILSDETAYAHEIEPEPPTPIKTRIRASLRRFTIAAGVVCAIGASYDQVQEWRHRRLFPLIGARYDIGGRSLNIYCSGAGTPTVVFESGAGGPGYAWVHLQREVAKFTRACWYDRAGYGWSDPAPYPRTSSLIAQDLHRLMDAARVPKPIVLVGASFGGMNVRLYNSLYPKDVAGMVLVDSSHFDERGPIVSSGSIWLPYFPHLNSLVIRFLKVTGLLRLVSDMPDRGFAQKWTTAEENLLMRSFEPRTLAENSKELYFESAVEARAAQGLGDKPLIVLTAGRSMRKVTNPVEAREALAQQKEWIEIQKQLLRLSSNATQVVVENSDHGIQSEAPEVVLEAIARIVRR